MELENKKEKLSSSVNRIIVGIVLTVIVMALELTTTFIGKIFAKIIPCQDPPRTSAPCYLKYDVYGFITLSILFVILILALIYSVIKQKKN